MTRLVAAVVVLLVALTTPPAHADRVTVTTQNVRRGLSSPHVRHDVRQAAQHSTIVLTQEMFGRVARRYAPPGWGTAHYLGPRGDCATYWSRDVWRFVSSRTVRIAAAPFPRGTRWGLVTILHGRGISLAVVNVHAFTRTTSPARRRFYAESMGRVRDLVVGLSRRVDAVLVGGDWNRTYRLRVRFGQPWRTSDPPRGTGPFGGRVDYVRYRATDFRPVSSRVVGGTFSDHDGARVTLGFTPGRGRVTSRADRRR